MAKNKENCTLQKAIEYQCRHDHFAMIFVYLSFSVYIHISGGITSSFMRSSREVL